MKTILCFAVVCFSFLFLFLFPALAESATWSIPVTNVQWVEIQNTSSVSGQFYVRGTDGSAGKEFVVGIAAGATQTVQIPSAWQSSWLQISNYQNVSAQVQVGNDNFSSLVPEGRSENIELNLTTVASTSSLRVVNVSPQTMNQGRIEIVGEAGAQILSLPSMPPGSVYVLPMKATKFLQIQIQADTALSAVLINDDGTDNHFLSPVQSSDILSADKTTKYFLFTNANADESFVVQSSDANWVAQARSELTAGRSNLILTVPIVAGNGKFNRDVAGKWGATWSWHPEGQMIFSEYASSNCNATPSYVESHLQQWMQSRHVICFWGYHIQRELQPLEVALGVTLK